MLLPKTYLHHYPSPLHQTSSYSRSTFILDCCAKHPPSIITPLRSTNIVIQSVAHSSLIVHLSTPCILLRLLCPSLVRPNPEHITLSRGMTCFAAQSRMNVLQQNKTKNIMKLIDGECWICCRGEVPSPVRIRKPNPYENLLLCLQFAIYLTQSHLAFKKKIWGIRESI